MTAAVDVAVEHEIGPAGLLVVRLHDGDARLSAVEGTRVRVRDRGGDPSASVEIDRGDGSLSLRAGRIGLLGEHRRGPRAADLEIEVPAGATVVVETASGDIAVDGLRGDQRYRTASGDLVVRDVAGALSFDTFSGDVQVIAVERCAIMASTVSGDLSIRAATIQRLRVSTTSGDIRLAGELGEPGPFTIETVSGDSVLAIAGAARIELRSVAGDLRSDLPGKAEGGPGHRTVTVGDGGPTVSVRSTSGDVRLVRATAVLHQEDPRMSDDAPTLVVATNHDPADPQTLETARLAILRELERGAIDVAEATLRLEAVEIDAVEVDAEPKRLPTDD